MQKQTIKNLEGTFYYNNLKKAFEDFTLENGHEPTSYEIDADSRFISSRQIQRRFGGLKQLRTDLNLKVVDFTKGEERNRTLARIGPRSIEVEKIMYRVLLKKYSAANIHKQYPYCDDYRTKADFCLWNRKKNHRDIIDIFYPSSMRTLQGCVNSKQRKYLEIVDHNLEGYTYDIWFVCANPEVTEEKIEKFLKNKEKKLSANTHLISYELFKSVV